MPRATTRNHFRAYIEATNHRGETRVSRLSRQRDGIRLVAQSWQGNLELRLWSEGGRDRWSLCHILAPNGTGIESQIASGTVGSETLGVRPFDLSRPLAPEAAPVYGAFEAIAEREAARAGVAAAPSYVESAYGALNDALDVEALSRHVNAFLTVDSEGEKTA
jgi:hypothetical protein